MTQSKHVKKLYPSVTLKTVCINDENEFLSAARASHEVHKRWIKVPITSTAFKRYVKEMNTTNDMAFVVRRKDNGSLVGVVELQDIFMGDFKNAYIIYYAFKSHLRQGLMTVAVLKVTRIAFSILKLHRLEANIQPENIASTKLAKACGFLKEGYSPKFLKKGGRWRDHERWALLNAK
jgi:ribosomal-protein-alanine N-acetyltransferase